jgi:hypothetical protein
MTSKIEGIKALDLVIKSQGAMIKMQRPKCKGQREEAINILIITFVHFPFSIYL